MSKSIKTALLYTISVVLLLVSTGIQLPKKTEALTGNQFKPERIMDDSIFFNGFAMGPSEVQSFLNAKVPICDTMHAAGGGYSPPFTCLKDFRQDTPSKSVEPGLCNGFAPGNKSAAEIIYQVGVSCGISQKVILVLLQKEQSLVTDTWPWPLQYRSATGYGCPDTAACDTQYYGFFNQVYSAARQFKRYVRDSNIFNYRPNRNNYIQYNPNAGCGGSNVYIHNFATAGLYNYTPYQPNAAALNDLYGNGDLADPAPPNCSAFGNRNFWRMYNDWFGTTTGTALLKGSGPTIFLLNNGLRYGIPSGAVLSNYGLSNTKVTIVSDDFLNTLADGGIMGMLFQVDGDPTVYLADNGRKHGIPSANMCINWGLDCTTGVKQITYDVASNLLSVGILQPLLSYQNTIFKMTNGSRQPYLSVSAVVNDGYTLNQASGIGSALNTGNQPGAPIVANGTLISFYENPTVYYYINGGYYGIPDGNTFDNWFEGNTVAHDKLSSFVNGPSVGLGKGIIKSVFKTTAGSTFILNKGSKIDISAIASEWPAPLISPELDLVVSNRPLSAVANTQTTYRTPNGAISIVSSGQRRTFAKIDDFNALGYTLSNLVEISQETISNLPPGSYPIGEGSVFKLSDNSSSLYLKGPTNSVYLIGQTHLNEFQLTRFHPLVPPSQLTIYDAPKLLTSFISLDGSTSVQYAVDAKSNIWSFGSSQKTQWGVNIPLASNLSSSGFIYRSLVNANRSLPSFAVYNGTVYYGADGVKHPIATQASYERLGGNISNTFFAAKDFIDAAPTGSIL